jgi:uncharacterized RDD family membrane protein YckC
MGTDMERLAQVFLWKQGDAPDVSYALELLRVANPDAYKSLKGGDEPPVQTFSVAGEWPDDPWALAIENLEALPAPVGTQWTDPAGYDLSGWQGKDLRTEENLFVVTAYRRPGVSTIQAEEALEAQDNTTPVPPTPQAPYQPQYPTGPIAWPPRPSSRPQERAGAESWRPQAAAYYPSRYSPLNTEPLEGAASPDNSTGPLAVALQATLLDSFASYYVGFGPRLAAMLIDLLFTTIFPLVALITLLMRSQSRPGTVQATDYFLLVFLGTLVFVAYHVVQIALWGRTLGKVLMGIRVVTLDGSVPGFGQALLRGIGYGFSLFLFGWGFLMAALDPRRQALHDKIAETLVIPEKVGKEVPAWLPGYGQADMPSKPAAGNVNLSQPAVGMAAVAGVQEYDVAQLSTVPQLPDLTRHEDLQPILTSRQEAELGATPSSSFPGMDTHSVRTAEGNRPNVEKARALFRSGLTQLEQGTAPALRGYKVEPGAARVAASLFSDALELVPKSVIYRYFYAVALRYSEGIEAALLEFKRVLELDPAHYEAQQQLAYGARWHDAFAYPVWVSPAPVEIGGLLPDPIVGLLPDGEDPVTRMVLLREGGTKRTTFLSRTSLSAWSSPPSLHMVAGIHLMLSRTPYGPILAMYVTMDDGTHRPYVGEAFLNPREPAQDAEDACLLGQHMLEQLARQDRTYFIFADESNRFLLSRKVTFNTSTQVSIARVLYEVQTLPQQVMEPDRFVEAARWHMEHVSLEQVKEQFLYPGNRRRELRRSSETLDSQGEKG